MRQVKPALDQYARSAVENPARAAAPGAASQSCWIISCIGAAALCLMVVSGCSPLNVDPAIGTTIRYQGFGNADPTTGQCRTAFTFNANNNPHVITLPAVVNLYWGGYYDKGNAGYAKRYWTDNRAASVLSSDRFWAPLKEYSLPGQTITGPGDLLPYGGFGANVALTAGLLTTDAIETALGSEIDNFTKGAVSPTFSTFNPWLQHQPSLDNTIWVIWLPPNVTTTAATGAFAYHTYFVHNDLAGGSHNVPYAVIHFTDSWQGYDDSMFISETHEIYETVTDPLGNSTWVSGNNEIGDVCSRAALRSAAVTLWDTGTAGVIAIQKEWSIKKCDCVDIDVYGAELTATPIVPGGGRGGPPCGVPGKPKCNFPALMDQHPMN